MKFWVVKDKSLAENLGISTEESDLGDVYLLRQIGPFCETLKPNVTISDYEFNCSRWLSRQEVTTQTSDAL